MFIFAHNWDKPPAYAELCLQRGLCAEDEQYWAFSRLGKLYGIVVKTRELTPKQILSVPCTTCGAAVGEACELHTGAPRTEPHRDRKLSAAEAVETKLGN